LDRGAIDIIDTHESILADRLVVPHATGFTWTTDGLYVSAGYTGTIARFGYDGSASKAAPKFVKRTPLQIGPGLLNGIAENPKTHRVLVARTAAREVVAPQADNRSTSASPLRDSSLRCTTAITSTRGRRAARARASRPGRTRRVCSWRRVASSWPTPMATRSSNSRPAILG
jgi:hypothetical protein